MKVVWHSMLLLTVLLTLASCFHTSDTSTDTGDSGEKDDGISVDDDSVSNESLQSFVLNYFDAVNRSDVEDIERMSDLDENDSEKDAQAVVEEFENFEISGINVQMLGEQQTELIQYFYNDDMSDVEVVSVLLEGHFSGEEADMYGSGEMLIRNDLVIYEQGEHSEIVGNYRHTPLSSEQSAAAQGGLLLTPEVFVAEYYQQLENQSYDELFDMLSEPYQQDELQMNASEYAEFLSEQDMQIEDVQVIMGELFDEDLQEIVPDLLAYTTDNDEYIVRVEYQPSPNDRFVTDDVLVSSIDDEWRISMIHRYE